MNVFKMIKTNFDTVIRLWLDQFAMMFFGTLVLLPTAGSKYEWLMPAGSAFAVVFYFFLLFITCCDLGLKDSVRIESGRIKKQWYKCTVLSLAANGISILSSIVACVSKALIPGQPYLESIEDATGGAASVCGIATIVNEILHIMYKGLYLFFGLDRFPFVYLFAALFSIVVCTVGYLCGTKGYFASLFARREKKNK